MQDWIYTGTKWQQTSIWPTTDRALHYGDGLFETIRLNRHLLAPLWSLHRERLLQGLIRLDFPINSLAIIDQAWNLLPAEAKQSGGKLLLSRGVAPRGYAIPSEVNLVLLWQPFAAPDWAITRIEEGFVADVSDVVLAEQPLLAGIKHLNRLEQILARNRMPNHCHEMLLCNQSGFVIEGVMSNVFFIKGNMLFTTDLSLCGVDGVIRRWIMQNHEVVVNKFTLAEVASADAVFFCNSLNGIIPVRELAGRTFEKNAAWQHALQLQQALEILFC